ncbi:putative F-box/LRR-repeat protein 23 [Quercus robur]|uniref:putative F-box/LRR-repeat protein 23 n=1 Tax=Quercus robur TaxID=38942 RepID=UPI002162E83C|nr:putative F-box/LRR-repeat protein 23 [Quercus robur]
MPKFKFRDNPNPKVPQKKVWKKKEPTPSSSSTSSSSSKKQIKKVWRKKEIPRNWLELPRDVTESILQRLGAVEILETAQMVCTLWRSICKEPSMWRDINMCNLCEWEDGPSYPLKMCRNAVDRSCGQLRGINIEYVANDELLNYIAQSSSQLRRLRLFDCYEITDEGLIKMAEKLPLLEELDITSSLLSVETIEAVGRHCPHLKSFKWNHVVYRLPGIQCDEEAVAVAKNMPELRHLQLIRNRLTNDGLQAILDNCPHLESLDLRKCFNVTLSGDLGRRCARIKNLRLPNDSTNDCRFIVETSDNGSFEQDIPFWMLGIDDLSDDYECYYDSDYSYDDYFRKYSEDWEYIG